MTPAPDPVLNVKQAADRLGVHPKTLEKYLKAGRLKGAKRAGRWFIRQSWLDEFLEPTNTADVA